MEIRFMASLFSLPARAVEKEVHRKNRELESEIAGRLVEVRRQAFEFLKCPKMLLKTATHR